MNSGVEGLAGVQWFARKQWDVVTREQLDAARISSATISRRVKSGTWKRLHESVYFVGNGEPCLRARAWGALTSVGDDGALSHRTAAEIDRLLDPRPGAIHITLRHRSQRELTDVKLHHATDLPPSQVTKGQILRRTTTARTLVDLAATENEATLRRALNEACHRGIVNLDELRDLSTGMRRGKKAMQRALNDAARTTNHLEDRFYAILRAAKLPPPIAQYRIGPYVPDFYWPDHNLIAETDGWAGHGHSFARLNDRRRDSYFKGRNIHTHRVPRRQLERDPFHMIAELAVKIARAAR